MRRVINLSLVLAFIAVSALQAQQVAQEQEPEILKQAPEGWRFERLDFPLQFAPELKFEGYEELRFAPGMFSPNSESYFSYALVMHLKNSPEVNEDFVKEMFEVYFRGLCKAVGESRQLELDLTNIEAKVEKRKDQFDVEIRIYDAFVTGELLDLHIEVTQHEAKDGAMRLLGLASPAEKDAEVWNQLRTFRKALNQ